jgi:hypothetical protein
VPDSTTIPQRLWISKKSLETIPFKPEKSAVMGMQFARFRNTLVLSIKIDG